MRRADLLPDLIIIGSPKSGTTSLHAYLAAHPQIGMSARKELKFFGDPNWRQRAAWYEAQFPATAELRGESSPSYSMYPFIPGVVDQMHSLVPDVKLVYLVRDPVERAVAHYAEWVTMRFEDRPVNVALGDFENPTNPYLCSSRFATQIEQYLDRFDPEQILVLRQSELLVHRKDALARIFRFLEVDETFWSRTYDVVHNPRAQKVRYSDLGFMLLKRGWLRRRGRGLIPPFRQLLSEPIEMALEPSIRGQLRRFFGPEIERLRELTGIDLNA